MDNERAGRSASHQDEAIRRGQLLEFIAEQKQRGLRKRNAPIRTKIARSQTKVRTARSESSKGVRKG
jgi:hypothetical protein